MLHVHCAISRENHQVHRGHQVEIWWIIFCLPFASPVQHALQFFVCLVFLVVIFRAQKRNTSREAGVDG